MTLMEKSHDGGSPGRNEAREMCLTKYSCQHINGAESPSVPTPESSLPTIVRFQGPRRKTVSPPDPRETPKVCLTVTQVGPAGWCGVAAGTRGRTSRLCGGRPASPSRPGRALSRGHSATQRAAGKLRPPPGTPGVARGEPG